MLIAAAITGKLVLSQLCEQRTLKLDGKAAPRLTVLQRIDGEWRAAEDAEYPPAEEPASLNARPAVQVRPSFCASVFASSAAALTTSPAFSASVSPLPLRVKGASVPPCE